MRGVIRSVGTVAPVRKRDKAREEEYGSIRPMSTMEKWAMSAQEAYASKDPMKRLGVVPDIGPAAGMTKALKGKKLFHGTTSGSFKQYKPKVNFGAGGDMYGEGLYFSEHPTISRGYAGGGPGKHGRLNTPGTVRTQNLPPQAKILDVDAPLSSTLKNQILEQNPRLAQIIGKDTTFGELISVAFPVRENIPAFVRNLGYDGISYKAGRIGPTKVDLPKGAPEGTKNYVIYNYDIINNPKSLLPKKTTLSPTSSTRTKRGGAK